MSTGAFFTSLIEPIFFKRRINAVEIILGLIVVGGLYIIFSFESQYALGIVYALISSFLFVSVTFKIIFPSSIKIFSPVLISLGRL